jgi:hypothetical protein
MEHADKQASSPRPDEAQRARVDKPRRRQISRACPRCHVAKVACTETRPCPRCVKLQLGHACVELSGEQERTKRRRRCSEIRATQVQASWHPVMCANTESLTSPVMGEQHQTVPATSPFVDAALSAGLPSCAVREETRAKLQHSHQQLAALQVKSKELLWNTLSTISRNVLHDIYEKQRFNEQRLTQLQHELRLVQRTLGRPSDSVPG